MVGLAEFAPRFGSEVSEERCIVHRAPVGGALARRVLLRGVRQPAGMSAEGLKIFDEKMKKAS